MGGGNIAGKHVSKGVAKSFCETICLGIICRDWFVDHRCGTEHVLKQHGQNAWRAMMVKDAQDKKKRIISSDVLDCNAAISIYQEALSIATRAQCLPLEMTGSGPERSMPTYSKCWMRGGRGQKDPVGSCQECLRCFHVMHNWRNGWQKYMGEAKILTLNPLVFLIKPEVTRCGIVMKATENLLILAGTFWDDQQETIAIRTEIPLVQNAF